MDPDLRPTVQALLRALPTQKVAALKQLFWSELNYDRAGVTLPMTDWPDALRSLLAEAPQLFATAGEGDGFHIIYCRLRGANQGEPQPPALGDERLLVGKLLRTHPYALFIFANAAQDHWHFVNVKYEQDAEARARRVFRRISVSPYETAGPQERLRTATERLSLLDMATLTPALAGVSPLVVQNRHDEAFDVEAVTRDFFATYRTVFEQVERLITGLAGEAERLFTQRLFNRLLFLIFLERKGWLTFGGRSDYLRALWEAHRRDEAAGEAENFYRDRLRLLFFSGLNTPNEVDVVGANRHGFLQQRIGQVPYLNGGLFEEDATDRNPAVAVPDRAIELILTRLLYHYNFTITESTPLDVEVAVDPEMLGKIFEELVTGRHESGSYYTPKPVVAFMGREAIKGYLEHACPDESEKALALLVDERDPAGLQRPRAVLAALRRVTICDLACGSGAYLLGMLHELMALRQALAGFADIDQQTLYDQKLEIIQQNLYGVDIDPFAVNIARLRLWLSLIVEYAGDAPPPLPNLDFKIETGDSLTAPNPAALEPDMFRDQQVRDFFALKSRYLQAHGGEKQTLRRQIDALRQQMQGWAHHRGEAQEGFDWVVEFAEIFDAPEEAHAGGGRTLSGAATAIVNRSGGQMELAGTTAGRGGFDIMLANPPYVRQELLKPEYKTLLKARYPEVHAGTADLYVYFYARALHLTKPAGMVVFISSNKFMRAGYGEKLRRHLTTATTLRALIDYGDLPLFTATAYPCIVATRAAAPGADAAPQTLVIDTLADVEKTGEVMQQRAWPLAQTALRPDGWALERPETLALLAKLRKAGKPLREYIGGQLYYGIKTGLNEAFIVDLETRNRLIAEDESSRTVLKPFLRGRDVKRWKARYADLWVIFLRHGTSINKYPAIKAHLEQFKERLQPKPSDWPNTKPWPGRKAGSYKWYEIQDNVAYWEEFERPKILIPAITNAPQYAFDDSGMYSNDKTSICIAEHPYYLLGILNSRLMWWFITQTASAKQGGFFECKPMYVGQIPIPAWQAGEEITPLVQALLVRQAAGEDVAALEAAIDAAVYRLFGVAEGEVAVVEG